MRPLLSLPDNINDLQSMWKQHGGDLQHWIHIYEEAAPVNDDQCGDSLSIGRKHTAGVQGGLLVVHPNEEYFQKDTQTSSLWEIARRATIIHVTGTASVTEDGSGQRCFRAWLYNCMGTPYQVPRWNWMFVSGIRWRPMLYGMV